MTAEREPSELGELSELVIEFMGRYNNVENEIVILKDDQKALLEEYEDRLDIPTLKQAIRMVKAKRKVKHQDTFDRYEHVLDKLETL